MHRSIYGLEKPARSPYQKKQMPFKAERRHQIWTADIRYVKKHRLPVDGYLYVISILENYSRMILASAVCRRQDLNSFLPVLYSAIERYGSPEKFVTDSGSIFLANRAQKIYKALNIEKVEIDKGQPWQSYIETNFNTQRKMADFHFRKAENWQELMDAHETWKTDYNAQRHWAHEDRKDGRHSPEAVLSFYTGVRYHLEDLQRSFFETRFARVLDALGYARLMHWRILGHEGLARREVALWLSNGALAVQHAGETLSRYEVEYRSGSGGQASKLIQVRRPELFETVHRLPQPRLFGLEDVLGDGWLKALKLDEYAPRRPRDPMALQGVLFPYMEVL